MRNKEVFADELRGLAALSVVIAHYVGVFWVSGPEIVRIANVPKLPPNSTPVLTLLLLAIPSTFNFGAFGVALFFLISGFVIPLSINRLGTIAFLRARAWRVVPTYAVGFSLTILALAVASWRYGRPFPYSTAEVIAHMVPGVRMYTGTPFIDFVVWTLEIEVIFYAICSVLAPWLRRGSVVVFAAPAALLAIERLIPHALYAIYARDVAFMFVGVALSFRYQGKFSTWATVIVVAAISACSLFAIGSGENQVMQFNYAVAAIIFATCYTVRAQIPDLSALRWLAAISYPLYVVHGVMGYVTMRILLDLGLSPTMTIILATFQALAISALLHFFVELPTQRIGKIPIFKPRPSPANG
jgi:peptidoglycan/LPS O-acetylase OafA/YrhL